MAKREEKLYIDFDVSVDYLIEQLKPYSGATIEEREIEVRSSIIGCGESETQIEYWVVWPEKD